MHRRKKHSRKKTKNGLFGICILLLIFVSIILGLNFSQNEIMLYTGLVIVIGIGILILGIYLTSATGKGKIGERKVFNVLDKFADKYNGKIVNNFIIRDGEKTSQIDHVFIHTSGIYVIETKNYSGNIYGDDNSKEWTQVLAYGNTKNKLYNPVSQNAVHILRLRNYLDINCDMHSLIVFVKGNIENINSEKVFTLNSLQEYIECHINDIVLSEAEIIHIYEKLNKIKEEPIVTENEHINNIKQTQKDINNNICPRCKGSLVVKISKNGNYFYGCSNYPRCKFTKNIKF